jgi:acetyltransferase-like isoleucine patch superfamily enzyme
LLNLVDSSNADQVPLRCSPRYTIAIDTSILDTPVRLMKRIWIILYLFRSSLDRLYSLIISQFFNSVGVGLRLRAFGNRITNPWNTSLGDNFSSRGGLQLLAGGPITVGNHVSCNTNVVIDSSGSSITIGSNVLIAQNVVLRSANHITDSVDTPIRLQGSIGNPIVIENDVWIAANCVVIQGVTIGTGTVVGAGSVVLHDLPPMTICAGNPARPLVSRDHQSQPPITKI